MQNESALSGVGNVVIEAKNATNVNNTQISTTVWNEFVNQYQSDYHTRPYNYIYNGVHVVDWLGYNNESGFVSLVKFLSDNDTDYPDATLKMYDFKNQLGL